MDSAEAQVQKHLVSFCKTLPVHVGCWAVTLQESVKPLQVLSNLCEQRRHIEKARVSYFDNSDEARSVLLVTIATRIEEELLIIKELIDKLNKCNNDLKNRLLSFERATLNLDWDKNTGLIQGNGTQPSLSRLLQNSLQFLFFFTKSGRNISECFRNLSLDNEKSLKDLQEAFNVNVDDGVVTGLVALTQYVDNENAVL